MSLGLYLHWPYCANVCPYCDFNVRRDRGGDHQALLDAIKADIRAHAARLGRRPLQSLSFGGGTPSLLSAADVAALIETSEQAFGFDPDLEISLEANPEHGGGLADFVRAGVNRLSLGVQALRQAALLALGRRHSVREAITTTEAAAEAGARVSIDLIYAREGQQADEWRAELEQALRLPIEHLSLYQLTIEAGTPLARAAARGRFRALDADAAAALYETTQKVCEGAGFPAYEISNHAGGPAAQSRHNLLYWRSEEWIGVGPGAHGRLEMDGARWATEAERDPKRYAETVASKAVGWARATRLSVAEAADEFVLMGLRLAEGLDRQQAEHLRGRPFNATRIAAYAEAGLLQTDRPRLALSAKGRLLADRIAAELAGD